PLEIGSFTVDPECVRVENIERFSTEKWECLYNAPTGVERIMSFVGYDDARFVPVSKMVYQHVRQVMHVDDRLLNAGIVKSIKPPIDQRFSSNAHQWLWHVIGEGSHARSKPGRARNRDVSGK